MSPRFSSSTCQGGPEQPQPPGTELQVPSPSSCPASEKHLHDNEACRVHTAQHGSASAPEMWILLSEGVLI